MENQIHQGHEKKFLSHVSFLLALPLLEARDMGVGLESEVTAPSLTINIEIGEGLY